LLPALLLFNAILSLQTITSHEHNIYFPGLFFNSRLFFRINRSDIINVEEIDHMRSIEGERTEIFLKNRTGAVYTSANRNTAFKRWLEAGRDYFIISVI
jgi:hypothetical protein